MDQPPSESIEAWGQQLRHKHRGIDWKIDGCAKKPRFGSEVVQDQRRIDACLSGDAANGSGGVADPGEPDASSGKDIRRRVAGSWPSAGASQNLCYGTVSGASEPRCMR